MFEAIYRSAWDLLGAGPDRQQRWLEAGHWKLLGVCVAIVLVGAGSYGSTIGLWRGGEQALYAGLKFPLVVLLTCAGNALFNGISAQICASGLSFRQTTLAIAMGLATASLVLLACVPLALFLLWNTPPLESDAASSGHSLTLLAHVSMIAWAGWVGNRRLYGLLRQSASTISAARWTMASWLMGNLLLGSQVSWILRPFIGNPRLPVAFLRDDPLRGSFYEQVWRSLMQLIS